MKNFSVLFNLLVVSLLIGVPTVSKSQEFYKEYRTNSGKRVGKSKADYVRTYKESLTGDNLWELEEYYIDNQSIRRKGKVTGLRTVNFHGETEYYYKNGQLRERVLYEKSRKAGLATYYYPNGQLHREVVHTRELNVPDTLINYFDSLGTALVVSGEGFVREVSRNGKNYEEGKYTGGLRVGEWKGTFRDGTCSFVEEYDAGELVEGVSTDPTGKEYAYREINTPPQYPDGSLNELRSEVASRYRYPKEALKQKLDGQVVLRFRVAEDGKMINHTIVSDVGYGTGDEGLAALKSIRKTWKPALQRGMPVSVEYTLPIRLRI